MRKRAASKIHLRRETVLRLEAVQGGTHNPNELPASLVGNSCWECPIVKPPISGDHCG